MSISVYRRVSNEYRLKLLQFELHYCELIRRHCYHVLELQYTNGTAVTDCPLYPIRYVSYNQSFRADNFPPNVPAGTYRLRFVLNLDKKEILGLSFYADVVNNKKT